MQVLCQVLFEGAIVKTWDAMQAAQDAGKKFAEKSAGPSAASPAAAGQEAPKSPAAVKKKGGAMYPPMPTLSQQQVHAHIVKQTFVHMQTFFIRLLQTLFSTQEQ